ncbi:MULTISPECIES: ankyrin repeat domain-containing protein [Burkholderia]|uniref:ankyrin repeat domain-containing protein n=1 Tax=Burkholderia TaxID=32008 RepID=UPI00158946EB|nr:MULTISPECIES: ankyrin repeat domain-containing protein [Burkholderia]
MAILPTFESVLLEISQCIGLERQSSKKQEKFVKLEMKLENHQAMVKSELEGIFDALEMSEIARRDALVNLADWTAFDRFLSQAVWTLGASARQVIWHMCAFSYAPAAGRLIANWNLGEPFDQGMPGGEFWFLPNIDQTTKQLSLPVQHVVDWLMDLLGLPMDQVALNLGGAKVRDNTDAPQDSMERTLYKWRNGTIPRIQSINDYFPDDATLKFEGALDLPGELPHGERIAAALAFVHHKKLDAEALCSQIPMTQPGRIEAIMNGEASPDEQDEFARLLEVRYARPSMRTVRLRLRIARAVQDGYKRLVAFLCPDVAITCPDANENKVLQLFGLFRLSYNLTVEAYKCADTEVEQDAWFERHLPPLDRATIFLSVAPSCRATAHYNLADLLTHRFTTLDAQAPLDDFFPLDGADALRITQTKGRLLSDFLEIEQRVNHLKDRVRTSSPWRALQAEGDYWAVSQLALSDDISPRAHQAAIERMRELAKTPEQAAGVLVCALGHLLNSRSSDRPRDVEQRVEALLEEAERSPAYAAWALPLLQYRAKHCLARNQFEEAAKLFRLAIDAGHQCNFGSILGETARDLFATLVADRRPVPHEHERPYRIMMATHMFEGDPTNVNLENVAKAVAEYFWDTLYKPYPGYPKKQPIAEAQVKQIVGETFRMIEAEDWDCLQRWFEDNAKSFREKQLDSVRGDSVLLCWLKLLSELEATMPRLQTTIPEELTDDVRRFAMHLDKRRHAICLLLKAWPEQANQTDFKRQTALMLAADRDDMQIVHALLDAGADLDLQDYCGRTAFHAAVKGASVECLAVMLAHRPDLRIVEAGEGNSALHTAVKLGRTDIAHLLVAHDPALLHLVNANGLTPLDLGETILQNWHNFERTMGYNNVNIAGRSDYASCVEYLRSVTSNR